MPRLSKHAGVYSASGITLADKDEADFQFDSSGNLFVNVAAGGAGGLSIVDAASWTTAVSTFTPIGGVFNDSAAALTSGQEGTARLTPNRATHVNLRNNAGTEIGTTTTPVVVAGNVAAGATDSGNGVKIAGVGKTTNPTAVTDGQRADALFDKLGKQVVVGSIRDLKGNQQTTITASTAETTIVTALAATFQDLYGLVLANSGASATKVSIRDDTGGTVRAVFYVPAGDTRGFMLPESGGMAQTVVNKNWTATCGTSTTSLDVTALFVKNT